LAGFLRGLRKEELSPAVLLIVGRVFPEAEKVALDVGHVMLARVLGKKRQAVLRDEPLSILMVNRYFRDIAAAGGKASRKKKEHLIESLLGQASELERKYILRSLSGEMRIGVSEGLMLEAIARAANVDLELLRRKLMFSGDLGYIAEVALTRGREGLSEIGIRLYTPLKPMLAEMAHSIEEVFKLGGFALEYKYDGARIQIHKGRKVRIFSRRLSDVTGSLPEIVELARGIAAGEAILEGEVVAVDKQGKPLPFQELMRRFRRVHDVKALEHELPLKLYLFDVLYLDGKALVDEGYEERWKTLSSIAPEELLAERIIPGDKDEAMEFLRRALKAGHEGLMAKVLRSPYTPGRRGKKWLKLKESESLDAAIIAAEWGHGRRRGWLSNYHLAVRDVSGGFAMVGKTFKGLTDEEFKWITRELQKYKVSEGEGIVYVEPRLVVEVAFDEIQRSPRYSSGYALRFARIKRIREDKSVEDIDTLDRLRELYKKQFAYKGRK
jgi:DNA ligase-1